LITHGQIGERFSPSGWVPSSPLHVQFLGSKNMKPIFALLAVPFLFTGCASIMNDSTHPMKVETKTADGQLVSGSECKLTNDYGSASFRSGDTTQVRRSNKDLDVTCIHPQNPEARARAISRVNGSMFGNLVFGGGIGAIIDHSKGTAYTYPTWIQLVFGKTLMFDRSAEKEGQPTLGTEPVATASSAASSPK
jgi:hypothetical protein